MSGPYSPFSKPSLPGYSFEPPKDDYRKGHSLNYCNGYAMRNSPATSLGGSDGLDAAAGITEAQIRELQERESLLTYGAPRAPLTNEFVPAHVAFDKVVLRFDAFFKQTVHESPYEQYRVRKVKIMYYVEDDSIAVIEPPVENSGIPQGVLIKRQRLPKDCFGECYKYQDFNVGVQLEFYGKVFKIVSCDAFTANFLSRNGTVVADAEEFPDDPYTLHRAAVHNRNPVKQVKHDKLKKFLENDRKVLRFYCIWDDRESMFGEIRPFVMHFFLVDDTVEVREVRQPNSGRNAFPILLKRQPLPRDFTEMSHASSSDEIDCYKPEDLAVGITINLFNRKFLLYDADTYTREFYQNKFGMEMPPAITMQAGKAIPPQREIPPYNGFGSEEDSLGSCISLVPKAPRKDFIKMLENEHKILRFSAHMESDKPEDKNRQFIVSYRLADDMMTVFEPPQRNAGILGGKFLERTRVRKPGSDRSNPQYYHPKDLYIGTTIEIFRHRFVLTDADEYCIKYLESMKFPHAHTPTIMKKISSGLGEKKSEFVDVLNSVASDGRVHGDAFSAILFSQQFNLDMSAQEVLTLKRHFDSAGDGTLPCSAFCEAL